MTGETPHSLNIQNAHKLYGIIFYHVRSLTTGEGANLPHEQLARYSSHGLLHMQLQYHQYLQY